MFALIFLCMQIIWLRKRVFSGYIICAYVKICVDDIIFCENKKSDMQNFADMGRAVTL